MRRRLAMLLGAFLALALVSVASADSTVTILLNAMNFSGINGQAILTDAGNNQTTVEIDIFNEPNTATEPVIIQNGPCSATIGTAKFSLGQVTPAQKMTLTTTITATLASLQTGNLSINVAAAATGNNSNVSVACGDIPAVGASAAAPPPAASQICPKSPCGLQTPPTNAPAAAALPKTGGVPPFVAVVTAGVLLGAGYALRRRVAPH